MFLKGRYYPKAALGRLKSDAAAAYAAQSASPDAAALAASDYVD